MRLEYQIIAALLLDLVLGDPRRLPHPVRLIGRFALALEEPLRRLVPNARLAGVLAALIVVGSAAGATAIAILAARHLHPWAGEALSTLFLYWSFAARDLADHALNVSRALGRDDLAGARRLVSLMVGRDTADMDKGEVARAAVESVAENTVDGVVAPLLFAVLAGPVGAMVYKAISTLDSTFGYRNERYREFGWASARLDDLANYLPARLTVPLVMLAALPRGGGMRALSVCRRDGRRHLSPNAGLAEAAVAGALGIQLGGPLRRGGILMETPLLGAPAEPPAARHIGRAVGLMFLTTALAAAIFLALRFGMTALARS
jgi:adenosylcobinamide-phosphate synthase